MAFKSSPFPRTPLPVCTASPKIAHFKGFGELAWANVGQIRLKLLV